MIGRTVVNGAKKEYQDITITTSDTSVYGLMSNSSTYRLQKTSILNIVLNEKLDNITGLFYGQNNLTGIILFNCNPTSYVNAFNGAGYGGNGLIANYTPICTSIDAILNNEEGVTKGILVI